MKVTDKMLEAAVQEGIKQDLIENYGNLETYMKRWKAMKACIEAAFEAEGL